MSPLRRMCLHNLCWRLHILIAVQGLSDTTFSGSKAGHTLQLQ